jgi:hypothetical protein
MASYLSRHADDSSHRDGEVREEAHRRRRDMFDSRFPPTPRWGSQNGSGGMASGSADGIKGQAFS